MDRKDSPREPDAPISATELAECKEQACLREVYATKAMVETKTGSIPQNDTEEDDENQKTFNIISGLLHLQPGNASKAYADYASCPPDKRTVQWTGKLYTDAYGVDAGTLELSQEQRSELRLEAMWTVVIARQSMDIPRSGELDAETFFKRMGLIAQAEARKNRDGSTKHYEPSSQLTSIATMRGVRGVFGVFSGAAGLMRQLTS